jgi:hypothetical protein
MMAWSVAADDAFKIRSFLLSGHDGSWFTSAAEPGRPTEVGLGAQIVSSIDIAAPWNLDLTDVHAVPPVDELPRAIAEAARDAGFAVPLQSTSTRSRATST